MRRIFLLFSYAAISCLGAGIDGTWNFVINTSDGERRHAVVLTSDGEAVKVSAGGRPMNISGTFHDNKLELKGQVYEARESRNGAFQMTGTLDGDTLKGSGSWDSNPITFVAQRAASGGIEGTWDFVWSTPAGDRRGPMTFSSNGETVKVLVAGRESKISGTFRDNQLSLKGLLYSPEAGQEGDFVLRGALEGGTLKGSGSWQEHPVTFVAQRAAAVSGVDGKWNFIWDTPGGERRSSFVFKTVDGVVKATAQERSSISGAFQDGVLKLSGTLFSSEAGQEGRFALEGKVDGNTMKGSGSWEEHSMTFQASRELN